MATAKQRAATAAGKVRSLGVNTVRANAGLINDIIDATIDQWVAGDDFEVCLQSAQAEIADAALNRHGDKVRAALARVGLDLPADQLSVGLISGAVSEKSGIDFGDFSPGAIVSAIDGILASRLSEFTGIEITSLAGNDLPTTIKVAVRAALRSGQAKHIIGVLLERKARRLATLKRLNSDTAEFKKLRNRKYQARWRENNKLEWVK